MSHLAATGQADTLAKNGGESSLATSNRILGASRPVPRFFGRRNRLARRTG